MAYKKKLLMLAKSKKLQGYCIAGKDIKTGRWVRPVRKLRSFTPKNLLYSGNVKRSIRVFDVIELTFKEKAPRYYQPENELIDPRSPLKFIRKIPIEKIKILIDDEKLNLLNTIKRNKISVGYAKEIEIRNSLQLIKITPENRAELIYEYNKYKDQYRPRLKFNFQRKQFILPVTDPSFPISRSRRDILPVQNAFCTISIGKEFGGYHYLLAVMIKEV